MPRASLLMCLGPNTDTRGEEHPSSVACCIQGRWNLTIYRKASLPAATVDSCRVHTGIFTTGLNMLLYRLPTDRTVGSGGTSIRNIILPEVSYLRQHCCRMLSSNSSEASIGNAESRSFTLYVIRDQSWEATAFGALPRRELGHHST